MHGISATGLLRWATFPLAALLIAFYATAQTPAPTASPPPPSAVEKGGDRLALSDEAIAAFFDRYISGTVDRLELPGGAIVVVRDGRTILAKGYGHADLGTRRPVDIEESLFRGASISKTFTWLLVMQLVEEGRLDLDRNVNAYLDFEIPEAFGRPITMRHLMTHSAGFADRFHGVFDPDVTQPLGQTLRNNIPERAYAPGTTIAYSNYGAALAGYIVQQLRGQPFERVVAERVFQPVGMRRSTFEQPVPAALQPSLVSTYRHGDPEPVEFRTTALGPMGALTASAGDMGRYLAMLLNQGQGAGGAVVAPASLQRMLTLEKPLGPGLESGFGLGFMVGEHRGVRYAGHGGNMTTLATDLEILPEHGLGWYYVFNGQGWNEEARKVRTELLNAAIEQLVRPPAPHVRAHGPSSAKDVAGSYVSTRRQRSGPLMFSALMDTTEAYAEEDGALTTLTSGVERRWLPAGRDRFVEKESGIPLAVTRGPDGRVQRIASAALYPASEFERAPEFVGWVEPVTKFTLVTLVLAVLAAPVGWWVARRRRRKAAAAGTSLPEPSRAARYTRPLARVSFWMIIGTLTAWGLFVAFIAADLTRLFTAPAAVRIFLGVLTMLSAPFAIAIAVDALVAWRDPARGWPRRIGGLLVAAAAVGMAWLFYVLDVTNFSADW